MTYQEKRIEVARKNPYHSVNRVVLEQAVDKNYIGVKDVEQIPLDFVKRFIDQGNYVLHTYDAHAWGGRAVDINIKHPVTGNIMSGSSSGTAVNVFCYLNDLGIGSDGGGSVLAPAMSLNLYGMISNLFEETYMQKFKKVSTDGIEFTPSLGFMCRTYPELKAAIDVIMPICFQMPKTVYISTLDNESYPFDVEKIAFPDIFNERMELIRFLKKTLKQCDFLISKEGPIDYEGLGDSIFGSFGDDCKASQRKSGKGLLRVVNMVNATAICVPSSALSTGYLLICESKLEKINCMVTCAEMIKSEPLKMVQRYFSNLDMYD